MGIFQSLGQLFDDLVEWLGTTFSRWIKSLVEKIETLWKRQIIPIIHKTFGFVSEVYVLFFKTYEGIVTMMTWTENKQPVMFEMEKAPSGISVPTPDQIREAPVYQLGLT
ncbi:MAG: hypothetical protein V7K50_20355 [Nostoc sp.]|uniref:hypothetical protein n=1 Tax=Nostoc sp. TaxID=1180 RepID=UPI002FF9C0B4